MVQDRSLCWSVALDNMVLTCGVVVVLWEQAEMVWCKIEVFAGVLLWITWC